MTNLLTRTLRLGDVGADVEACKRAVYRYLHAGEQWNTFIRSAPLVRKTFGLVFLSSLKAAQLRLGLEADGKIGPATETALRDAHAFDLYADQLLLDYASAHRPALFYPNPAGPGIYIGQGLHQTGGLPGNWAIDFMAPGGTPVLASCDATVVRLSGHDPKTGLHGSSRDVFGWSLYLKDKAGRTYFLTHLGDVIVSREQKVKAGQQIGRVGRWPRDPGRSHTHLGCTSPKGAADAKARVLSISRAPRLPAL